MNLNLALSCDDFKPADTSSTLHIGTDLPRPKSQAKRSEPGAKCQSEVTQDTAQKTPSIILTSTSTLLDSNIFDKECAIPKLPSNLYTNLRYEQDLAKSMLQQYSTISGDNLFDHLADIIKRVIDERPPNVIDFFEEFSRNVREQKLHLPERFPPEVVFEENRLYKVAKRILVSMKLPYAKENDGSQTQGEEELEEEQRHHAEELKLELKREPMLPIFRTFYDRVQHLQFFWNQCGFSVSSEDIFQLAAAMNRLQTHPLVRQCRFWGMFNGLKAPYYVVEAHLSQDELDSRGLKMQKEIMEMEKFRPKESKDKPPESHIGPELTPGAVGWDNHPTEGLDQMKPSAPQVPLINKEEIYDVPPEVIGHGVNRYSYFVVNTLSNDWVELPTCSPQQIIASRQIKKFLTGDLDAELVTHPCFPGRERNYLRALIARITAGTYIAPKGYYRKMKKREKRLFEGFDFGENEEEEDDESDTLIGEGEEEEELEIENDLYLIKNEKYEQLPLATLNQAERWVHVRPNILDQGRVVWYNEEKARRDREKERKIYERKKRHDEMGLEEDEEQEEEEEEEGEEEEGALEGALPEIGPTILTPCSRDISSETSVPWVPRFTSNFTNHSERILIMKSNVWPGAFTFTFENLCESIYLGWGHKYLSRNMAWVHMPSIAEEFSHGSLEFVESTDPSVELEEEYRLSLLKKELKHIDMGEQFTDYENDTDGPPTEYDDDDEEEEEEEEEEE